MSNTESYKTLRWQVAPLGGTPGLRRTCPRCGCDEYISSRRFRVNANARRLDVWLVFNCKHCKNSYNLTILARVSPQSIPSQLLAGFYANDTALADQYARDAALLGKNGVAALPAASGFTIQGESALPGNAYKVMLHCPTGIPLRLDKALAQKTGLSRAAIARLAAEGLLWAPGKKRVLSAKLSIETEFILDLRTPDTNV